jgi:iron complex transport system substrate-binding protein
MKKILIYFFLVINIFAEERIDINKLQIIEKNGITYTTLESLNNIHITIKKVGENFIIQTDIGKYTLTKNKIKTKYKEYKYLSTPFKIDNLEYLPLNLVLELSGYRKINGKIIRYKELSPPAKYPTKIISISPSITEKIFALGGESLLVGRSEYSTYPKEVEKIDVVGSMFEPNLEIILDKKPDLIVVETHFRDKLIQTFNSFGIKTLKFKTPNDTGGIYQSISDLGVIIGRKSESRGLNASLKDCLSHKVYLLKDKKAPKVYYVLSSGKTDITAGGNTFINSLIELAKGKNIASNKIGWQYSLEELIINNPDIIFGNKTNIEGILKEDNYKLLTAVQNKNYYIVEDDTIFNLPGPLALTKGVDEMIKIFHPDVIPELEVLNQ